jgi:hypothetical protein
VSFAVDERLQMPDWLDICELSSLTKTMSCAKSACLDRFCGRVRSSWGFRIILAPAIRHPSADF